MVPFSLTVSMDNQNDQLEKCSVPVAKQMKPRKTIYRINDRTQSSNKGDRYVRYT